MDFVDAMFGHVWPRYHDQETILHQSLSDDRRQRLHGSWTRSGKNQLSACGLQRYSSKITSVLYMSKDAFKWVNIDSDRHKSRLSLYKPFPKYHNIFLYSALALPYFIFIKKSAVHFKLIDSFRLNSICHGSLIRKWNLLWGTFETNGNVSVPIKHKNKIHQANVVEIPCFWSLKG